MNRLRSLGLFLKQNRPNVIAKEEVLKQSELTPSPFPLPCGERIEERGKRKFLYNQDKFKTSFAISRGDCFTSLAMTSEGPAGNDEIVLFQQSQGSV